MSVELGGKPPGEMPQDGRPYVVVGGKWMPVASDEADGIPPTLDLPDNRDGGGQGGTA